MERSRFRTSDRFQEGLNMRGQRRERPLRAESDMHGEWGVMRSCDAFCEEVGYKANRTVVFADWRGLFFV
jgi:hypothetical protein